MTHTRKPPIGTERDPIYISVVGSGRPDRLDDIFTLLCAVKAQGDCIMSQLDDLTAVLTDVDTKVEAISVDAGEIRVKFDELLAKLENLPPSVDLSAAIAQAQGISDRLAALDAALDAIPGVPPVVA